MIQKIAGLELHNNKAIDNEESKNIKEDFGAMLNEALQDVNEKLLESQNLSEDFIMGKDVELHHVVLANEQAGLALQMTLQVRNKVIEAYQEIMRMQV